MNDEHLLDHALVMESILGWLHGLTHGFNDSDFVRQRMTRLSAAYPEWVDTIEALLVAWDAQEESGE